MNRDKMCSRGGLMGTKNLYHAAVCKYISAEIKRCDLGEVSIFDNNLNCSDLAVGNNSDRVARAAYRISLIIRQ